ncbi:hypothetical protein RQD06_001421 [Klebsiella pneumoniae]|nr:hypothetical protein [Klebsiella pneumoniae]
MINAPSDNAFDIQEKLKAHHPMWSYMHEANSFQQNTNYEFCTNFIDGIEFAIYERHENHFILVDFFKSYDDACREAKNILDTYPDVKNRLLSIPSLFKGEHNDPS